MRNNNLLTIGIAVGCSVLVAAVVVVFNRPIVLTGSPSATVAATTITPAVITGFALAFARSLGEYGSVVFISGNMPFRTEIAPVLVVARLEEFNYAEATAIAVVLLGISFVTLFAINLIERWSSRHHG